MTESERQRYLAKLKEEVHKKPIGDIYNNCNINKETNCYAYAIGGTIECLKLYRIGSISNKKPIDQEYFSIEELKFLLFEDLKTLNLIIEKSSETEKINDNQYKIALYVKIYADKKIHDFHFLRYEDGIWSEKFKWHFPRKLGNTLQGIYNYWPWNLVGIYKITR